MISISLTPEGDPQLSFLDPSPNIQYTAISHVWIGGLGNFSQNQLPRCQLLRIHSLRKGLKSYKPRQEIFSNSVSSPGNSFFAKGSRIFEGLSIISSFLLCLYRRRKPRRRDLELAYIKDNTPVIFWMDTLCIPVGLENASLRADSINKMDLI